MVHDATGSSGDVVVLARDGGGDCSMMFIAYVLHDRQIKKYV